MAGIGPGGGTDQRHREAETDDQLEEPGRGSAFHGEGSCQAEFREGSGSGKTQEKQEFRECTRFGGTGSGKQVRGNRLGETGLGKQAWGNRLGETGLGKQAWGNRLGETGLGKQGSGMKLFG
ncbi:hypothetical protein GCM10022223_31030 [Kineosporia mesophila]|uniref:Uncharacterized protein n=1 Tax=Kineosporia mesophila TaxID=566012 RepID=A0ABP6ZLL1_9ACTN